MVRPNMSYTKSSSSAVESATPIKDAIKAFYVKYQDVINSKELQCIKEVAELNLKDFEQFSRRTIMLAKGFVSRDGDRITILSRTNNVRTSNADITLTTVLKLDAQNISANDGDFITVIASVFPTFVGERSVHYFGYVISYEVAMKSGAFAAEFGLEPTWWSFMKSAKNASTAPVPNPEPETPINASTDEEDEVPF